VAALLLFAAAAGASAGVVALTTGGSRNTSSSSQPIQVGPPGGGFFGGGNGGQGNPANPGQGGGGSSSGNTGTGNLDQNALQAKVDPAIVDITVSLAGGQGTAEGTGMIITSGGQVLTNNHVIDGASTIKVQISGQGDSYNASVVGYDVNDDVALLQMHGQPSNLTTITIGDPSSLNVGDSVLALGNALGRGGDPQPAAGTITALDQTITAGDPSGQSETLSGLIETNARIQPGDSGGPLIDSNGRVIGMDTAASVNGGRFRRFGGATGQGYAIPIDTAMQIVEQIRNGGAGNGNIQTGQRALLGVGITDNGQGATVQTVQSGSPAESAGIVAGDVITSVGGAQVTSASSLQAAILKHKPGDRVSVTWDDSNGRSHSATVTLISGPPA
jgi:S1-C subfamily serine protease